MYFFKGVHIESSITPGTRDCSWPLLYPQPNQEFKLSLTPPDQSKNEGLEVVQIQIFEYRNWSTIFSKLSSTFI